MNEITKDILKMRYNAIKTLRASTEDLKGKGIDVNEIIEKWGYSGLYATGCPRCGESFFWTPPFGYEKNGKICGNCLFVSGVGK